MSAKWFETNVLEIQAYADDITNIIRFRKERNLTLDEKLNWSKQRLNTWTKIAAKRCAAYPYIIFNRVPNFHGAEKAANLLSEIDEYKNASKCFVCLETCSMFFYFVVTSNF